MIARKFIASTVAALTVAGGIGLAYAQTGEAPMNPPTQANTGPGTNNMTGSNNTLSNANTPTQGGTMGTMNNAPTTGTTQTPGSDTLSANTERPMQADRN